MSNWELISLLVNGILALLWISQQRRLKSAETTAVRAQTELEETRSQGATMAAVLRLLEGQLANTAQLARAINDSNELRKQEDEQTKAERKQHADVVAAMLDNNTRVITMISEFQNFSREQHDKTRSEVGGKVDEVSKSLQAGREDFAQFRKDLNGRFLRLEPSLKHRFESGERKLDDAIKQLPDTDKLNPDHVPDSDPAPPTEPPPADAA